MKRQEEQRICFGGREGWSAEKPELRRRAAGASQLLKGCRKGERHEGLGSRRVSGWGRVGEEGWRVSRGVREMGRVEGGREGSGNRR